MVAQFSHEAVNASPKSSFQSKSEHFQSFQGFQDFIRDSFINGSGIDPELFDACVEFHQDIEAGYGGDWSAPIHESLGWDYKRFRQQANTTLYAAFLKNEDGSIWQAIVSLWDEEKQRPYRYLAPKGQGDRAFLPPIPVSIWQKIAKKYGWDVIPEHGSFWEWLELMDIPRIVTEGGKKSLAALSQGYVAIALFGCECGLKEDYLIDDLSALATPETTWLIGFDADSKRKAQMAVARGRKKLTTALQNHSCYVAPMTWDAIQGKGLDDLIVNQGSEAFDAAYGCAIAKINKFKKRESGQQPKSKIKQAYNLIQERWGERLRFNQMTLKPELDGLPIKMEHLKVKIAIEFDLDIGTETATQIVLMLAQDKEYHPVQQYLDAVAETYPAAHTDSLLLNSIAYRYLGSADPLHNVFLRNTLIAAVARIYDPGCQVDTVCTLQGKQGIQKSKFWRALTVDKFWFDDTVSNSNTGDKDERLKLRRFWFLELAEIEAIFKKKEIANLRGFLTTSTDNIRVPYGRSIESFPRTSIFVGSVNPDDFLVDPEGHRRFWVVPVMVDYIDVDRLAQERDQLWAAAVHAYRAGQQHYLTRHQEKLNARANKRFESTDSWLEVISSYVVNHSSLTTTQILSDCLKIEIGRHDKASQMRVSDILKRMGWTKGKMRRHNGERIQPWVNPEVLTGCCRGADGVLTEVLTASSPDISSILEKVSAPFDENGKDFHGENEKTHITQEVIGESEDDSLERNLFEAKNVEGVDTNPETKQQQALDGVSTSVSTPVNTPVSTSVNTSVSTPVSSTPITKGSRVRVHCPGSKRDGKEGVVTFVKKQDGVNIAVVNVKDVEANLKVWECPLPSTMLDVIS